MEFKWDEYIAAVGDGIAAASLKKLQSISGEALKSGSEYAIKQCQLIHKYTEQKGKGLISEDEYNSLMKDLGEVMKLEALKVNLATRKVVLELAQTCLDIALNCVGALIVF